MNTGNALLQEVRPHIFTWKEGGPETCRWCGCSREAVEDGLVSVACASSDPVERALHELRDDLEVGLQGARRARMAAENEVARQEDRERIYQKHLDALRERWPAKPPA